MRPLTGAAARPGFKAVDMGLKADAEINNTVRRFTSSNVIAWLPGGQRKHEYVVYGAHWDGLGRDPERRHIQRRGRRRDRRGRDC